MTEIFDVAVIGAGVVGCAIARELARYDLRCVLVEASDDVGTGTSKANTAILHTGYDGKPGYLETRLLRRGYQLLRQYGPEAGIPIEQTGALLVAWTEAELQALPAIRDNAHKNGVTDVEFIPPDMLYQREPHLGPGALGALEVPGESIICPFTTPLAYATQAVINGVDLRLNSPVQGISRVDNHYVLHCPENVIHCCYLVNAAGLYADTINRLLGYDEFTITPRRGELIVYDKVARSLVRHILMPVPSKATKGVMIGPTVFGNVLLGPTAENLHDRSDTGTTAAGLQKIQAAGRKILPELMEQEVTAVYAGLRSATENGDYCITLHAAEHYLCVGGIRSTGLSASMGIAEYAVEQLAAAGLRLTQKTEFLPVRMPNIGEAFPRPWQCDELILSNPDYGRIVCHCERVSKGEILDAARAIIPARSVDGLRRRTRAQMGRCQGFFCAAAITVLIAQATGIPVAELTGQQHESA